MLCSATAIRIFFPGLAHRQALPVGLQRPRVVASVGSAADVIQRDGIPLCLPGTRLSPGFSDVLQGLRVVALLIVDPPDVA